MESIRLRLTRVELFDRAVTLRLPFRFGAATVTQCPQAFVRVEAEAAGHGVVGATAELMVPKWFDKSAALSHAQNFGQLRDALGLAREAYLAVDAACSPWQLARQAGAAAVAQGVARGLPRLAAQFGAAQLDKAVADAALRAAGLGWCDGLAAGVLGDPYAPALTLHKPASVALRHTVGLLDRLDDRDAGADPHDGLPTTLQQAVRAGGLRFFKLKLGGQQAADLDRLARIAALLDAEIADGAWHATLDGNETFASADALAGFWQALRVEPRLRRLHERLLLLEQPLPRAIALQQDLRACGIDVPVILDESDDADEVFAQGLALGYRGISSKACKGLYRSLHSAWLIERQPTPAMPRWLLSGEDLTCQAGLAVQQDTLLAASLGVTHIERNGHHYVDGFGVAPAAEALAFAAIHPGLYRVSDGRPRLVVSGGRIDLTSLHGPGFASGAMPDWPSLQAIA